jgi:hypothetical protein
MPRETYEGTLNVTDATYLEFVQKYRDADDAVAEAVGERKDLRKIIKGAGIHLKAFDRSRKDGAKSGEAREEEDREYRQYMAWQGKPVGYQLGLDFAEQTAASEQQLRRAEDAGKLAAKHSAVRGANPGTPNTELAERWDRGWLEVHSLQDLDEPAIEQADAPPAASKRRGRPRGPNYKPRGKSTSNGPEANA